MSDHDDQTHREDPQKAVSRRTLLGGAAGSLGLAAAALTAAMPQAVEAQSVEGCFFALEIQDFFTGAFQEASGIGSETETAENGGVVAKVPGRAKWGDITLKRGITSSLELYSWRRAVEEGRIQEARKSGSIIAYDQSHTEVARWNFVNAWPNKVEYGGGQSSHSGPLCAWEALTLDVEFVTRVR